MDSWIWSVRLARTEADALGNSDARKVVSVGRADHLLAPGLAPRKGILPGVTVPVTCSSDLTCGDFAT